MINHAVIGPLTLAYERLQFPDDDQLSIFVHVVQPGTESAEKMALLASRTLTQLD